MNPPAPRAHHIPELLEIHADELAYLWGQRRAALADPRYTLRSFCELNERIEAHAAGLLTVPSALPALLGRRLLAAADRDEAFAAAHVLLRLGRLELRARLLELFATVGGPQLLGLRDALMFASPSPEAGAVLAALADGAEPQRVLAALTVLAHWGRLAPQEPALQRLL
ncbi:MAG: hypothetical protein KGL43_13865, partial [Burkholderiales bacterium]|nr:hypothetical protein [Burkholderiales bacterium]